MEYLTGILFSIDHRRSSTVAGAYTKIALGAREINATSRATILPWHLGDQDRHQQQFSRCRQQSGGLAHPQATLPDEHDAR